MIDKLNDTTAPAMTSAIEANLFALYSLFHLWPDVDVYDGEEMLWTITDIPFPLFNSILRTQLAPEMADEAVEAAIARAKARNVPFMWWTGPVTQPADLGKTLMQHEFIFGGEVTGMAMDLQKLDGDSAIDLQPLPGIKIEEVDNVETLKIWSHTLAAGFGMPDFVGDAMCDLYIGLGFGSNLPGHNYIGWLNGEPVATVSVMFGAGVAGIYNVTTAPSARRQGIGKVITLAALRAARKAGYRVAILQSSDMGVGVYRRLGFQEYCKIGQYVWMQQTGG